MNRDEVFQRYEETIAEIDKASYEAHEKARVILREYLKVLRNNAHGELKAIRALEQKTKRSKK